MNTYATKAKALLFVVVVVVTISSIWLQFDMFIIVEVA